MAMNFTVIVIICVLVVANHGLRDAGKTFGENHKKVCSDSGTCMYVIQFSVIIYVQDKSACSTWKFG